MRWHWQRRSISSFCSIVLCLVVTETSESLHVASTTTHSSAPEVETTRTGAAADIWSARTRAAGDIRCFCNLPVCVATGYMCKSEGGGCFSDLEDYSDVYRAKHGCLEMLDRRQQEHCHEPGSNPAHPAVLWCCHKDMCNHIDSPENFKFNTSEDRLFFNGAPQTPIGYNNNEVWFKAATIAVPICGALILFVLIALAIKILRRDGIEQGFIHGSKHGGGIFPPSASHALVLPSTRKASQYHLHNLDDMSSKKVPLLLQHRNESSPSPQCIMLMNPNSVPTKTSGVGGQPFEKNEANAKLNLAGKSCLLSEQSTLSDYTLLVHPLQQSQDLNPSPINLLQKPNNNTANTNLYRNVNLTLAPVPSQQMPLPAESKLYDKQHLASVVTWGEATGSASHV